MFYSSLIQQNESLKEQLLVSQYHNSQITNELNEALLQVKHLTKKIAKYE
jgi:hypothetical protein